MIITDITVNRIDRENGRFPDPIPGKPFTDVYLLTATMADGTEQECPFFVFGEMTADHASDMLKVFASAIGNGIRKAA